MGIVKSERRECIVKDCTRKMYCRSLCSKCYHKKWRKGLCNSHKWKRQNKQICVLEDCPDVVWAKRLCKKHYNQVWRNGDITHKFKQTRAARLKRQHEDEAMNCERKLKKAKEAYANAGNLSSRLFWKREIEALEKGINPDAKETEKHIRSA